MDLAARTVSVLTLHEGVYDADVAGDDGVARPGVLPGFKVSVVDLFTGLMDGG